MSKILIADDDPAILHSLKMLLEEEGHEVTTTVNGGTVQDVRDDLPDVILLDIWMSGMDGRVVCRRLKNQPATKAIPIIMMSANNDTQNIARQSGADDFILKPFDINDLLKKVEVHINASK